MLIAKLRQYWSLVLSRFKSNSQKEVNYIFLKKVCFGRYDLENWIEKTIWSKLWKHLQYLISCHNFSKERYKYFKWYIYSAFENKTWVFKFPINSLTWDSTGFNISHSRITSAQNEMFNNWVKSWRTCLAVWLEKFGSQYWLITTKFP